MDKIGGKYEVIKKLGEGATSTVYLAYDPFAEREVAVKLIFPDVLKDKERGRQFRHLLINEASLAGKLIHPHIVQIYDAVIGDAESYIVMEYVPGGTLEQFCSSDALLPIERVVEIIFKCTRALEYANRLGITHRDIKPANILLAETGEAARLSGDIKISDFGACLQTIEGQTQTQVLGVGSPAYMSPEQVREGEVTHQTDIYALGVVMYQLLTGRLPFMASSNYGMIYQICNIDPPPPSTFRNDIPAALDAVVARAMQKELKDRYPTWAEFSHDLAQAFKSCQLAARRHEVPDSEKFENLRSLSFFDEFSDVELWEVVRFARWEANSAGTRLMKDGEPGDHFCFILEGELAVSKQGHTLGLLGPGEVVGEMAVLDRRHPQRVADVTALTDVRLVVIPGTSLRLASASCRMHFYQGFLQVLAERLSRTNLLLAQT
ncbi:MAG: serine/threonine-protein kinase [Rhodocyclaceae bacterium]|nr:serine/threonine-protein kinase [Rhodocyclaceae bacterium]